MESKDSLNLVWITDLHLSDEPPGRRSEHYKQHLFDKLEQVRQLCVEHNAYCLVGGDVFHIKNPRSSANSLGLIRECIELFGSFPKPVLGCVGNHDIRQDRMDTLPHQPLGILVEAGVYQVINPTTTLNQGDIRLQIDAFDYADGAETYRKLVNSGDRVGDTYRFGVVHASGCSGDSREFFSDTIIGYNQLKDLDYDILFWGHDHTRTETEQCGNVTHINLGSLSRASLSEDETERPVSAVLVRVTADGIRIKECPLKVVPLEQAFRIDDKKVLEVNGSVEMKEFFSDLSESVQGIESSDPIEVIETLCKDDAALCAHIKEKCNI